MQSQDLIALHRQKLLDWSASGLELTNDGLLGLVEQNHAFNYQLWQEEDKARREDKGFEYVHRAKRNIDHFNQQRNNRMESIDQWLWESLSPSTEANCNVHSETPGMMVDRLSILELKRFHMKHQAQREDVGADHKTLCQQKYQVIVAQQTQLGKCLDALILDIKGKTRTFRLYHQFKMYNDPTLNPELYAQ